MNPPIQRSEINVTPLIDVCLVLLLIFMIVAPLMTAPAGPAVALPETEHPQELPAPEALVVLFLDLDGSLTVGGERWAAGTFAEKLPAFLAGRSAREVVLRADRRVRYAEVREVLRLASLAELPGMSLATTQRAW